MPTELGAIIVFFIQIWYIMQWILSSQEKVWKVYLKVFIFLLFLTKFFMFFTCIRKTNRFFLLKQEWVEIIWIIRCRLNSELMVEAGIIRWNYKTTVKNSLRIKYLIFHVSSPRLFVYYRCEACLMPHAATSHPARVERSPLC